MKIDVQAESVLKQVSWATDRAMQHLPSSISCWWAQLAALEAEWMLSKHVDAQSRIQSLRKEFQRSAKDQPILLLRLEGTAARLYAQQADWRAAAWHTERCCDLAEIAYGRTHSATLALRARSADAWARAEGEQCTATACGGAHEAVPRVERARRVAMPCIAANVCGVGLANPWSCIGRRASV